MAEVTGGFVGFFTSTYDKILAAFSGDGSLAVQVLIFSIVLAVVSLFIWEFYKSTSKRNLIKLNLNKYNVSDHPLTSKFLATLLYLLEYMIIMPLLILLWYAGLSIVLLLVASGRTVDQVLLLSAVVIGAIRILAYFKGGRYRRI